MEIVIRDLPLLMRIGCYAEEKKSDQRVVVNLAIKLSDGSLCVKSDDLKLTVDYAAVIAWTKEFAQSRHFQLVETFVWTLGEQFLKTFPLARDIDVRACKIDIAEEYSGGAKIEVQHRVTRG